MTTRTMQLLMPVICIGLQVVATFARAEIILSSDFTGVVKNTTTKIADSYSWDTVSGIDAPATSLQFIDGDSSSVLSFFNVTANEIDVNNNMTAGGWDTSIPIALAAGVDEIALTNAVLHMRLTNGSGGLQNTTSKSGRMIVELVGGTSGSLGTVDPGDMSYPSDVYTRTLDLSSLPVLDGSENYTLYIKARGTGFGHHKSFQGFEIKGTVTLGALDDEDPPTPAVMTFAIAPHATGESAISMSATTAEDPSGVEYYFAETSGSPGGSDSGWQSSTNYTDTGLSPGTEYTYTVQARDLSANLNSNTVSAAVSTNTDPDTSAPTPDAMTFATAPTAITDTAISMTATTASDPSGGLEYLFTNTVNGDISGWISGTSWTNTGLLPGTEYTYQVKARDALGNETAWSDAVAATTPVYLALYQFDGGSYASTDAETNSTASDLAAGAGIPLATSSDDGGDPAAPALATTYSPLANSLSEVIAADDYYTFTITPGAGKQVAYEQILFNGFNSGGQNVDMWVLSSLDGFDAVNVISSTSIPSGTGWAAYAFDLSSMVNDVSVAVTFRIYLTDNGASTGSHRIRLDHIRLVGSVTDVPPSGSIFRFR